MENAFLINRLLSGQVFFRFGSDYVVVKPPSVEVKTFADVVAMEAYENAIISCISPRGDNLELEQKIQEINSDISNMKVDYHNNFFRTKARDLIITNITQKQAEIESLSKQYGDNFDKSADYIRDYTYISQIIEQCCYVYGSKELASKKYNLERLISAFLSQALEDEAIRNITKSNVWRVRWVCSGDRIFLNKPHDFTNEQITAISWSKFYDNVYESMYKPHEDIIQDNIALDGWAILQHRKYEAENGSKQVVDKKPDRKGDLFLPATSSEDVKRIIGMNSEQSKNKMASIIKQIEEHGEIKEADFKHVQNELRKRKQS